MIDKDKAELKSTKAVWGPDFLVRLCQFHVIQAIRRWVVEHRVLLDGSSSESESDAENEEVETAQHEKPYLPRTAMSELLQLFRCLQRVRNGGQEWKDAVDRFAEGVRDLCVSFKLPEEDSKKIIDYFEKNWFKPNP
ncbi:hypothetical protein QFC22_002067 [Naganishia vaughanmartiniae]|uniref:Uncharacterized protein n=1 Tax=Naganishia vaughanmartiniae TaxID=1424756 RepID=A0ACC2XEI3_9TREE|nr:hypothetical protein QFC22_002067 [Naganishia vaughanmartiniae]